MSRLETGGSRNGGGGGSEAGGRICRVGLTGGLASGKSTVAKMLARLGAPVLDADRVVHELYEPGQAGAIAVRELLGSAVIRDDGSVDRAALGSRVLADDVARRQLDAAIHPLVRQRLASWLEELAGRAEPPRLAVVEAALLVETGSFRDYDVLVVVWCSPSQQLERAVGRGVEESRARALIEAQMPLEDKRRHADIEIDNTRDEQHLQTEVARAWARLGALCGLT